MSEEWSPWIEHDGSGCPVIGQVVMARWMLKDGSLGVRSNKGLEVFVAEGGDSWFWEPVSGAPVCAGGRANPIIRYRLRRPPAVRLLVDIAETLHVRELEDA